MESRFFIIVSSGDAVLRDEIARALAPYATVEDVPAEGAGGLRMAVRAPEGEWEAVVAALFGFGERLRSAGGPSGVGCDPPGGPAMPLEDLDEVALRRLLEAGVEPPTTSAAPPPDAKLDMEAAAVPPDLAAEGAAPRAAASEEYAPARVTLRAEIVGESYSLDGGGGSARLGTRAEAAAAASQPTEAAPAPPVAPTEPRPRHLQARLPEKVRLGDRVYLEAWIALIAAAGPSASLSSFAVPAEGADVTLLLHCPGFIAHSPTAASLHVPADADSPRTAFALEAEKEGDHVLELSAYNGAAYLGTLPLKVSVGAGARTEAGVDRVAPVGVRAADPGEVTLEVEWNPKEGVYYYQFRGALVGEHERMPSSPLLTQPRQAVEALVRRLNAQARGETGFTPEATRRWLRNQGMTLWDEFIPAGLKSLYWEFQDRITRMTIMSRGDPVPWEVLYPTEPDGARDVGFLAEQFPVVRWVYGGPASSRLKLSEPYYVMPEGSPASAATEVDALRGLLGEGRALGRLEEMWPVLDAGFDVLHFACHNTFEPEHPDHSWVRMGGEHLEPTFLTEYRGRFRERAPLIFMNACRSDGTAPGYTRLDGWADSFLRAGAGAFVGSLWEVRDNTAAAFSQEFYRSLRGGANLGESIRAARSSIREVGGDPTWLAYTVYGDPAATVEGASA